MIRKNKKIFLMLIMLIFIPSTVFANELVEDYNKVVDISKILLGLFSGFGYTLAIRNINLDRNKIHAK